MDFSSVPRANFQYIVQTLIAFYTQLMFESFLRALAHWKNALLDFS